MPKRPSIERKVPMILRSNENKTKRAGMEVLQVETGFLYAFPGGDRRKFNTGGSLKLVFHLNASAVPSAYPIHTRLCTPIVPARADCLYWVSLSADNKVLLIDIDPYTLAKLSEIVTFCL